MGTCTVPMIITHGEGTTFSFYCKWSVTWNRSQAFTITHKDGHLGNVSDPNRGYRTISATGYVTSTELNTINGFFLPASAPTYDSTDPKILLCIDGDDTKSLTILAVMINMSAKPVSDKVQLTINFEEWRKTA